jgi:hypothetical protein
MDAESINIKEEIHQLINDIDDIEFLKAVQTIISAKIQDNYLSDEEIQIVEERREKYLKDEGKTYTWDEVKAFAKSSKSK